MSGMKYDVNKGMWDPAVKRWIFPGEEINCRCFSRPIIHGFSCFMPAIILAAANPET